MGIIIRQSLKASLGSYIGVGIGIVNQLYVSTKVLETDQLAISRLLLENSLVFAAFAHLGTPFIADRFFGYFRDNKHHHHGFLGFLLLYPLLGVGLFTAGYFLFEKQIHYYFAEKSAALIPYHILVIPLTLFWSYIIILEAYCRNNARIAIPTFIREVYLRFANLLVVLLFGLGWYSFDLMLYLMVACYGGAVLILLMYIVQIRRFSLRFDFGRLRNGLFQQMAYYGLFIVLGGVGINLVLLVDRTMLSSKEGLTDTAIFIIATYIAGIIEIPRKAITQISSPLLANSLRESNISHIRLLYQKSALHQLLVGGLVFLLIWVNIDDIFFLLPKGRIYFLGKQVVLFIALSKLFDMATGLNGEIITYSPYYRLATYMVILIAIFAVIANYFFIPLYGYDGAAYATALTTLVYAFIKTAIVWRLYRIAPFTTSYLIGCLVLGSVYLVSLGLPGWSGSLFGSLITISFKSVVLSLLFVGLILGLRLSEDINQLVVDIQRRVVLWLKF